MFESDLSKFAYGIVEDGKDNIKQYSLNLFDVQTALVDFCRNFTQREDIKQLKNSESFYRKMNYFVYHYTKDMFQTGNYSLSILEGGLAEILAPMFPRIEKLLQKKAQHT